MPPFFFRKPDVATLQRLLAEQRRLDLTYAEVGATATSVPARYAVNHTRVALGAGERFFAAAKSALERWSQFQLGWLEPCWPATPLRVGEVVGVLARRAGLWWLNACRIVYVIDEDGPVTRFGFAYGTLPLHAGCGEERFLLEFDHSDGTVWYDVLAFSRPYWLLAKATYPYFRHVQKQFGPASAEALRRAATVS